MPASPLCGVATWARWYQAPKTVKLPLWGGPRLHVGGAGAKNASCFFGRTLRNVHFGNARSTPLETFPLTQSRCLPITINHHPVIGSHQSVDQWENMYTYMLTCLTHQQSGGEIGSDSRAVEIT